MPRSTSSTRRASARSRTGRGGRPGSPFVRRAARAGAGACDGAGLGQDGLGGGHDAGGQLGRQLGQVVPLQVEQIVIWPRVGSARAGMNAVGDELLPGRQDLDLVRLGARLVARQPVAGRRELRERLGRAVDAQPLGCLPEPYGRIADQSRPPSGRCASATSAWPHVDVDGRRGRGQDAGAATRIARQARSHWRRLRPLDQGSGRLLAEVRVARVRQADRQRLEAVGLQHGPIRPNAQGESGLMAGPRGQAAPRSRRCGRTRRRSVGRVVRGRLSRSGRAPNCRRWRTAVGPRRSIAGRRRAA